VGCWTDIFANGHQQADAEEDELYKADRPVESGAELSKKLGSSIEDRRLCID
jgi:hypothetical protein